MLLQLQKQEIGLRLAAAARGLVYKENIAYMGPVYDKMSIDGNIVRIKFNFTGSGLVAKGDSLTGFAIAGDDHKFYWATGKVTGKNTLEISSPEVRNPVAVRYGWGNNPDDANLYNSADLPASPFRTDKWKGITE